MVEYEGTGVTPADPVVVRGVKDAVEGLAADRNYLNRRFGKSAGSWKILNLEVIVSGDEYLDKVTVELESGNRYDIYSRSKGSRKVEYVVMNQSDREASKCNGD